MKLGKPPGQCQRRGIFKIGPHPCKIMTTVIGVIPARYGSTRLEGKVLADIGGKPMMQHVWERASKARLLNELLIAVDDPRVEEAAKGFAATVVMTSPSHTCGTERVEEAVRNRSCDIAVNIQGDEPFLEPGAVDEAVQPLLDDPAIPMATVMRRILSDDKLKDPGVVKVVADLKGFALYFSRSLIPYPRKREGFQAYEHLGIYAYRAEFISKFVRMAPTPLERVEVLEMLRAIENGYRIRIVPTRFEEETLSVDTPDDLEKARMLYARMMAHEKRR